MTALALRLAVAGGREQLARLLVAALGVALATGFLLLAGVLYPALHAHDARQAWTSTAVHNIRPAQNPASTDPLLWRLSIDHYDGKLITWVDVAALGPRAPLPPGLTRLPGPGELAVSPAMAQLLRTTPARILGDRYPGKVAATVGNAALVGPGQLIIFVGHAPAQLRAQPWVISVRSIESAPLTVPLTRQGQTVLGIGVMAILVPILVLVGTAARLSAARRERRLAAMRLIGATPRQIKVVAAVEAALAVVAGTVLGFGVFALIRPLAAHIDVDGSTFFLSDLRLSLGVAALVALGVPALGVSAALVSLRRVQISPLGVTRRAAAGQPTWRRLILLVLGLTAFAATLPALTNAQGGWVPVVILGTIGLVIVGIVVAGPLLTLTVGRLLARLARRPPALLAGRRLADNPAAGFRAISGLILAVFVVTLVSEFSAVTQAPTFDGHLRLPAGSVTAIIVGPQTPAMNSDQAATLISQLTGIAGVGRVIALRVAPSAPSSPSGAGAGAKGAGAKGAALTVVARCSDLLAANLARCSVPASTVSIDGASLDKDLSFNISDTDLARPVHGVTLDRLPLAVVVVTTNGQLPVIEAVRTRLDIAVGAAAEFLPMTTADIMAQNLLLTTELGRIGTAALLATLLIAGLSMAISIAGGLLERKQPFTLLRLSGLPLRDLHRMLLAETAVPLVTIAVISTGFGLAVAAYVLAVNHEPWLPPSAGYWPALAGGLLLALGVAAGATMPLLGRLTSPESARVE